MTGAKQSVSNGAPSPMLAGKLSLPPRLKRGSCSARHTTANLLQTWGFRTANGGNLQVAVCGGALRDVSKPQALSPPNHKQAA